MRPPAIAVAPVLTATLLGPLAGQRADSLPAFNALRTPTSPAFVLLGVAPTAVERPNTPADVAFSVLNRTANLTSLPRDAAVEFSPYWLLKHAALTWEADTTRGIAQSIARTATVSFATAEVGTSGRPVTGVAVGVRAAPFSGRLSDSTVAQLRRLEARLAVEGSLLNELMRARAAAIDLEWNQALGAARTRGDTAAATAATARRDAERTALAEETMDSPRYRAAVESTEATFRDLAVARQGFVMELAGGAVWEAAGGAADSATLTRWGAWLTAGYEGPAWSFVFVNRFLVGPTDSTFDALDVGIRLLHAARRFALSAEGVFRTFTEPGAPANQYRFAAVVDYEIRPLLWLNATFGRDFAGDAPGSLIAQFGLSLNLAGERLRLPHP